VSASVARIGVFSSRIVDTFGQRDNNQEDITWPAHAQTKLKDGGHDEKRRLQLREQSFPAMQRRPGLLFPEPAAGTA